MKDECVGEMSEVEIDKNLAETFPASDPPSWTLGTGHKTELPDLENGNIPCTTSSYDARLNNLRLKPESSPQLSLQVKVLFRE